MEFNCMSRELDDDEVEQLDMQNKSSREIEAYLWLSKQKWIKVINVGFKDVWSRRSYGQRQEGANG